MVDVREKVDFFLQSIFSHLQRDFDLLFILKISYVLLLLLDLVAFDGSLLLHLLRQSWREDGRKYGTVPVLRAGQ